MIVHAKLFASANSPLTDFFSKINFTKAIVLAILSPKKCLLFNASMLMPVFNFKTFGLVPAINLMKSNSAHGMFFFGDTTNILIQQKSL